MKVQANGFTIRDMKTRWGSCSIHSKKIRMNLQLYREDQEKDRQVALAMKGLKCPTFAQVQRIAELIADQYVRECGMGRHLILVLEEDIGKAIGNKDHSTVLHGCNKIEEDLKNDVSLQNTIDVVIKKINPQP